MPHFDTYRSAFALCAAGALLLTACGDSTDEGEAEVEALEQASGDLQLDDVCPSTLTIQLQWQPQSDHGALFHLLGPDYEISTENSSVSGTLVASGQDTGIELELRAGGPAIGFQSVPSQMYVDDEIDLGLVHSDQLIAASADQHVVGLAPLLTYSPAMLMWDPEHFGDDFDLTQLEDSDATVVVSSDQIYPAWLIANGYVSESQLDPSYDGNPARFAGDPTIVQQGFANSEPWTYEHETPEWGQPVDFQLLRDLGYDIYASNLSARAGDVEEMAPCLERFVPIVQQSNVDYISDPAATNELIIDVIESDQTYTQTTLEEAEYGAEFLLEEGLVAEENGAVSIYDMDRVEGFVDELIPMIREQGNRIPDDMTAEDLFTDEFGDETVTLP